MHAVILVATHEKRLNVDGREVPLPLVDVMGVPYLTAATQQLLTLDDVAGAQVVTNEAIKPDLDRWLREDCPPAQFPIQVLGDGTVTPEGRLGAVGDLLHAIETAKIDDDVLVLGGDNWFHFDLRAFVESARKAGRPAVLLSAIERGTNTSRFGWVKLAAGNRIIAFVEHPTGQSVEGMLKASCVYWLGKNDRRHLTEFAASNSTRCSPGTFFAWLAGRAEVVGLEMAAVRRDIEERHILRGADFFEFRDIVRRAVNPKYATWEREAAKQLQWVTCHGDLLDACEKGDPNKRIVAARLLGESGHLLSEDGKKSVVAGLIALLGDESMNDISYAGFEGDEASEAYVSASAAEALARLGYAPDAPSVFAKARERGHAVEERRNRP